MRTLGVHVDEDATNFSALTDQERSEQMRSHMRDSMFLLGEMARPGGTDVPIKVRNLSAGGMMCECPTGFVSGEPVVARLPRLGRIEGKVAWAAGARIGVAFDAPIDPKRARRSVNVAPQDKMVQAARSSWRPGLR